MAAVRPAGRSELAGGRPGRRGGRDPAAAARGPGRRRVQHAAGRGAEAGRGRAVRLAGGRGRRRRPPAAADHPPPAASRDVRAGDGSGAVRARGGRRRAARFVAEHAGRRRRRGMAGGVSTDVIPGATVTPAVARSLIDQAKAGNYPHGVLGVRALPAATKPASFTHRDQPVRIVPAASALAVREAIRQADPAGWLVVVTDRSDDDLGAGLLAQFVWQRLRHPDPWQAVRQRFGAHGIDAKLLQTRQAREVATGLLELSPNDGWPPAPAGVLTRDHALACVARAELGLPEGPVDLIAVLQWSTRRGLPATIARLRSRAGEATVDAVLGWVADAAGEAAPLVAALLRAGTPTTSCRWASCSTACSTPRPARTPRSRSPGWSTAGAPCRGERCRRPPACPGSWSPGCWTASRPSRTPGQLLVRADELLAEAQAQPLAGASRLLRSGLTQRLRDLAEVLRHAPDADPATLAAAWAKVADHALSGDDPRVAARARRRPARPLAGRHPRSTASRRAGPLAWPNSPPGTSPSTPGSTRRSTTPRPGWTTTRWRPPWSGCWVGAAAPRRARPGVRGRVGPRGLRRRRRRAGGPGTGAARGGGAAGARRTRRCCWCWTG